MSIKFHIKNKVSGEETMNVRGNDFTQGLPPGWDMKKVSGQLVPSNELELYCQVEIRPEYNPLTEFLTEKAPVWSDVAHEDYPHAKQYIREWEKSDLSTDQIKENLKQAYIQHKEEAYPTHDRISDSGTASHINYQILTGVIGLLIEKGLVTLEEIDGLLVNNEKEALLSISEWLLLIKAEHIAKQAALDNDEPFDFQFTEK